MNIVVLSPHRDDAAFSLGLAIKAWLAAKHRVTVLGVFTRSLSAPYSDANTVHPNDLLSYVSAMRKREDAELLKLMPKLRMVDLNLKDAPVRLRCAEEELYTLLPRADDTAIVKLQKALAKLDAELKVDAVLIPLGLGHHVDHRVVRNAALEFAATRASGFFEDLPDAMRAGAEIEDAVNAEIAELGVEGLKAVAAGVDADAVKMKMRLVSVYASQIDRVGAEAIAQFAMRYEGGERIWVNEAWAAGLTA